MREPVMEPWESVRSKVQAHRDNTAAYRAAQASQAGVDAIARRQEVENKEDKAWGADAAARLDAAIEGDGPRHMPEFGAARDIPPFHAHDYRAATLSQEFIDQIGDVTIDTSEQDATLEIGHRELTPPEVWSERIARVPVNNPVAEPLVVDPEYSVKAAPEYQVKPTDSFHLFEAILNAEATHPSSKMFYDCLIQAGLLHAKKQRDYGKPGDPFANVRSTSEFGVPAWIGAMIRLNDKVKRLQALARNGELHNESAIDSLMDIAVYALIARVLYEEEE